MITDLTQVWGHNCFFFLWCYICYWIYRKPPFPFLYTTSFIPALL